ncbi:MAG: 6,7-dimethyl-8-ribityllumazine synthase [Bacteroidetes bacterium]|nr:MAG: 6,7-dimethyl-8-ribityllumazine synthase [Bacteroidota bacterium]
MSEKKKNLSDYDIHSVPDATNMSFAILVSEWNHEITFALRDGAVDTLKKHGAAEENIIVKYVPGSFELPSAAKIVAQNLFVDAIICIGCVIQGETRHFEFINNAVANGITKVAIESEIPVIFGVLTPDTMEQAKDRAGGKHGNKGDEAAISAIKMADLSDDLTYNDDQGWDELDEEFYDDDDEFYGDDDDDDLPFDDDDNKGDFSKLN